MLTAFLLVSLVCALASIAIVVRQHRRAPIHEPPQRTDFRSGMCWLIVACSLFCFASCQATPEQVAVVTGALTAGATELLNVMRTVLSPEQFAKLQGAVHQIDGTAQSTQAVVSSIVEALATIRDHVNQQLADHAHQLQVAQATITNLPTRAEALMEGGGYASAAVAVSRFLSLLKHGSAADVAARIAAAAPDAAPAAAPAKPA